MNRRSGRPRAHATGLRSGTAWSICMRSRSWLGESATTAEIRARVELGTGRGRLAGQRAEGGGCLHAYQTVRIGERGDEARGDVMRGAMGGGGFGALLGRSAWESRTSAESAARPVGSSRAARSAAAWMPSGLSSAAVNSGRRSRRIAGMREHARRREPDPSSRSAARRCAYARPASRPTAATARFAAAGADRPLGSGERRDRALGRRCRDAS